LSYFSPDRFGVLGLGVPRKWFSTSRGKGAAAKLDALLPAILDKAFTEKL